MATGVGEGLGLGVGLGVDFRLAAGFAVPPVSGATTAAALFIPTSCTDDWFSQLLPLRLSDNALVSAPSVPLSVRTTSSVKAFSTRPI